MIALIDQYGEIYQLRHTKGFAFAAIFGNVEQAVLAKITYKLDGARIIQIKVK